MAGAASAAASGDLAGAGAARGWPRKGGRRPPRARSGRYSPCCPPSTADRAVMTATARLLHGYCDNKPKRDNHDGLVRIAGGVFLGTHHQLGLLGRVGTELAAGGRGVGRGGPV